VKRTQQTDLGGLPSVQRWNAEDKDLNEPTFAFALRIIRLCQRLDEKKGVAMRISSQLLRSGTSIGANYEEAQAGQSRADFISKSGISLKEARETRYWLRLLAASEILSKRSLGDLLDEAEQLTRIFGAIVSRSRKNSKKR
jgi:four helix bundle protein